MNLFSRKLNRFGFISYLVLIDEEISIPAKALYGLLTVYCGDKRSCYPSREKLAYELGVSVSTIHRALKNLEENGIIRRQQTKEGSTTITHLTDEAYEKRKLEQQKRAA